MAAGVTARTGVEAARKGGEATAEAGKKSAGETIEGCACLRRSAHRSAPRSARDAMASDSGMPTSWDELPIVASTN